MNSPYSSEVYKALGIIENCARNKQLIFYSELYKLIDLDHKNPGHRKKGASILAEVNEISLKEKKVMVTSLVISAQENDPNKGFFDLAKQLHKLDHEEELTFWMKEVKKVFKAYK